MQEKLLLTKSAIKWVNEYYEQDGYIALKIFRKDLGESYDVLIDKSDFNRVSEGQWYVSVGRKDTHLKNILNIFWTKQSKSNKTTYGIHQWILDTKNKNIVIDHINTNRLDNRRKNLRFSDPTENAINQTYKGYNYDSPTGRYLVRISTKGYNAINLGRYKTEIEAETMYLKAMILLDILKLSEYHKKRAKILNVVITDEDFNNKYIKRFIERFNIDINTLYYKQAS